MLLKLCSGSLAGWLVLCPCLWLLVDHLWGKIRALSLTLQVDQTHPAWVGRWPREGLGSVLAAAAHSGNRSQEWSLRLLPRQSRRGGRVHGQGRTMLLPAGVWPLAEDLLS